MDDEMWNDMEKIIKYLESEIGAQAIILCGSRSVGDYKENSDWDMKVLTTKEIDFMPYLEGYDLDFSCHDPNTHFSWEEFGWKLRFCEVITDTPSKDAQRIVNEAREYYAKGPKPWSVEYAKFRKNKVIRYEKKFADCIKHKDWFQLHQRLAWHFLENTYTWWYGIRGEWEPRPQQLMKDLHKRDPHFATLLKQIVDPKTTDIERVEFFRELHKNFFASKVYQDYIRN
jgi:hypothetical protein